MTREAYAMSKSASMKSPAYHHDKAEHYLKLAIRSLAFSTEPPIEEREAFVRWRSTATLDECLTAITDYYLGAKWPWASS